MESAARKKRQKEMEGRPFYKELKDWAKENKDLLEVFLDAYCLVDITNNVVDFNIAFNDLCGESFRKVIKIADFCELIKTESCPHQCPARQILTSHKPVRIDELGATSKAFPKLTLIMGGIPLFTKSGEIMGSFITIRNVTAEDELQKKYLERKNESMKDGLTGIFNKVFTEISLLRTVKSALRHSNTFSVAMLDIDHFKDINDTYGHQTGDYVLSKVAGILADEVRGSDLVGRVGGEEFMAVLQSSDQKGVNIFAERLRKRIEETEFLYEGKAIAVTISVGTATFIERWRKGIEPETCMKQMVTKADKALYYAKNHGRNQIRQFETLED